MKKLISTLSLALLFTGAPAILTTPVYANSVNVSLNGELVDAEGVIVDGRTLVPVRAISELLGGEVSWNESLRLVTVVQGDTTISLTIDDANAVVNGQNIELDVPAQIREDRTFVPLRFIGENFGIDVDFVNGVVVMTSANVNAGTITFGAFRFTVPTAWRADIAEDAIILEYEQPNGSYAIVLILQPDERFGENGLYDSEDRIWWEEIILESAFEAEGIEVQNTGQIGIFEVLNTDFEINSDNAFVHGFSYLLADEDYIISVTSLIEENGLEFNRASLASHIRNIINSFERID